MPTNQSLVTVREQTMPSISQGQNILAALFVPSMVEQMAVYATDGNAHPDIRRSLLQRAASITREILIKLTEDREDTQPEHRDLYDHRQQAIMPTVDAISTLTLTTPTHDHEAIPTTDDHDPGSPNDYWRWLQAHMQTFVLPEWIENVKQEMINFSRTHTPQGEVLAVITQAVSAMADAYGSCRDRPDRVPADGLSEAQLDKTRRAAAGSIRQARQAADQLVADANAKVTMTDQVLSHASIMAHATREPLAPNMIRTIIAPDADPDGPAIALMYPIHQDIHVQMVLEDPREEMPPQPFLTIVAMAMRHIVLDFEEHGTEPPETVRLHVASAAHAARETVRTLTPDTMRDIISESRRRGVPDSALQDAIDAACSHFMPASAFVMSQAGMTAQRCSNEVIQAIAATLDSPDQHHLLNHIATLMHVPTHLVNLPRATVAPEHIDRIANTARRHRVPEHSIRHYTTQTDDGSSETFNPAPPYHNPLPHPADIFAQPRDEQTALACQCMWCQSYQSWYDNNPRDALSLAIRHQGQAKATDDLIRLHQRASRPGQPAVLDVMNDVVSRLCHSAALNQPYSGHPLADIINDTIANTLEAWEYINRWAQQQTETEADDPIRNAARHTALAIHCNAVVHFHEAAITADPEYREHNVRHLQAMHLAADTARATVEIFSILPEKARAAAREALGTDAVEQAQQAAATLEQIRPRALSALTDRISQGARENPELLQQAKDHPSPPLNAHWAWTTDTNGMPTKPAVVRRYHQGAFHYATSEEPSPTQYPISSVREDFENLQRQILANPNPQVSPDLLRDAQRTIIAANLESHDIRPECWSELSELTQELGLPAVETNRVLDNMSQWLPHQELVQRHRLPVTTEHTARRVIQAARDAGADERQLARLADVMEQKNLVSQPQPIAVKHARALARTARKRGVPRSATHRMQETLSKPAR